MGGNHLHAGGFLPADEVVHAGACHRHREDRAHGGAHGFKRKRVGGLADENDAGGTGGIGRADDRAEVAGIAHPVQRHIGFSQLRLQIL
ncbi:hypothetical protein D9M70_605330 [compost metagenome]